MKMIRSNLIFQKDKEDNRYMGYHLDKISSFIEEYNGDILIEVFGTGWSRCNYKLEYKHDKNNSDHDCLICWHEQGECVFHIYESWFCRDYKDKYNELSKEAESPTMEIEFHFYGMGVSKEYGPYLEIYYVNNLQFHKSIEIYKELKRNSKSKDMKYISTNKSAITVEQLIKVLESQDKTAPLYILDDNLKLRPILDIGIEDGKILICDF